MTAGSQAPGASGRPRAEVPDGPVAGTARPGPRIAGLDPLPGGPPAQAGSRLDDYLPRYSARAHGMTSSEIRALFSVASRPEVVSLAGGMPNLGNLPLDVIGTLAGELIAGYGTAALQYGSGQGEPAMREAICEVMRVTGVTGHPDDVTVTVGSQQALDLLTRVFCDPGDVVVAEGPSYVGALGVFRGYQAQVVHVAMDHRGLVPALLDNALRTLKAAGRRVKFLYTIPSHHNPAGVSMDAARRAEIARICSAHDVFIIEDDPYGLLGLDGVQHRPIRADNPDNVIYLGSFSKTFAPGVRVGWALTPHAVREKLVLAQESATLCPPVLSQHLVTTYLAHHDWLGQVKTFREMYRERRDAMLGALAETMPAISPEITWTRPDGGFYVWLQLPPGVDAKAMLPRALRARVAYVSGTAFYADGFGSRYLRLSYCYPTPERIREGVHRLARVLAEELDVRRLFGAGAAAESAESAQSARSALSGLSGPAGLATPGPDAP